MSYEQDPPRLSQTRDDELAELLPGLERARAAGPSPEQLARICAGVAAGTAPPPGSGPSGQAAPSTPSTAGATAGAAGSGSSTAKLATVIVTGTLLGAVAFLGLRNVQERVPADRTTRAEPAAAAPPIARALAHAPAQRTQEQSVPAAEQPAVARRPAAGGAGHGAHVAPSAEASEPDVNLELALLKRARAEVRPNPARALALTQEHAARFARGALTEEREVIAIEALLVLGRRSAAEQRAHAFFASYPGSAHARRVRSMFGEHGAALSDESPSTSPHPSR